MRIVGRKLRKKRKMSEITIFVLSKFIKKGLLNGQNVVPEGCPVEDFPQLPLQT